MSRHALRSRRVVTPEGVVDGVVVITHDKIEAVYPVSQAPTDVPMLDVGDAVIMPGLVDTHVHINEPGRTEWEGFETATKAAAAGGITTLVDMPLNCIPVTTSLSAFQTKLAAIENLLWVDCGFYGGVIPGNTSELSPMIQAGVLGFKAFLIHSGIDDFPNATPADLQQAMPVLAKGGVPLLVHSELDCTGHDHTPPGADPREYATFLASRPGQWEVDAISEMMQLSESTGCRTHIVHLSCADAVSLIADARAKGLPVTAETCPHYLTFSAEEIPAGDTRFKCAPPIRERSNREQLWEALKDGHIEFVVSDHSPCTPELKLLEKGDFLCAWGGISSLQFGLPVIWTHAKNRGFDLTDVTRWMCESTARFVGLDHRKGKIQAGYDADLIVWDPDTEFQVRPEMIQHRHKITPYADRELYGQVKQTYLRGQLIYEEGRFTAGPVGQPVLRSVAALQEA